MQYKVNDRLLSYSVQGEKSFGNNDVLLQPVDDLTQNTVWKNRGYTIEKLFSDADYILFKEATRELLFSLWQAAGLSIPENFLLENYHKLVHNQEHHLQAVDQTKLIHISKFPGGISKIEQRISAICQQQLQAYNPFDGQSIFHFRVIRPGQNDNNPLHKDVWLEDYSGCINLYIPIAGSNELSSLILIPESHRWPESKVERTKAGSMVNNIKFNVPAVTQIEGNYTVDRPSPGKNEVLIFSPYLIHGGAINLNEDITRISIELRLWKKTDY
jgi:hypothetical protein